MRINFLISLSSKILKDFRILRKFQKTVKLINIPINIIIIKVPYVKADSISNGL